jgi:hypothetical protein
LLKKIENTVYMMNLHKANVLRKLVTSFGTISLLVTQILKVEFGNSIMKHSTLADVISAGFLCKRDFFHFRKGIFTS